MKHFIYYTLEKFVQVSYDETLILLDNIFLISLTQIYKQTKILVKPTHSLPSEKKYNKNNNNKSKNLEKNGEKN